MINPSNYCYGIEGNEKAHKMNRDMVNIYYTLSNLFTHLATHSFIQLTMPQFTNIYIYDWIWAHSHRIRHKQPLH